MSKLTLPLSVTMSSVCTWKVVHVLASAGSSLFPASHTHRLGTRGWEQGAGSKDRLYFKLPHILKQTIIKDQRVCII